MELLLCSHSPELKTAVDLLPSGGLPDQNGMAVPAIEYRVSQDLIQLLSSQQQSLSELRNEHQRNFEALQSQILALKTSIIDEQKVGFAEMKVEHRILIYFLLA